MYVGTPPESRQGKKGTIDEFLTSHVYYLVSQCQAIHARSIFPCQDTPDVKCTFDFNIKSPLPVIASGLPVGKEERQPSDTTYHFQQKVPIPTYLFALASG